MKTPYYIVHACVDKHFKHFSLSSIYMKQIQARQIYFVLKDLLFNDIS